MDINRFLKITAAGIKIIWYLTGIILLLFLLAGGIFMLIEMSTGDDLEDVPQLVVGEKLEKAKAEGLILQGITYDEPSPILYTDYFLLPVSVKTYENPESANRKLNISASSLHYQQEHHNVVNIIFMNSEFGTESVLLNKKAFIKSFRYPSLTYSHYSDPADTIQRNITYQIAFEDSNKDGLIDAEDESDLYLSDLNGKNLNRITEKVNITKYYFLNRNEIIVKYQKRDDRSEEHKKEFFALYRIREKELKELSSLNNTLEKIEKIIVQ